MLLYGIENMLFIYRITLAVQEFFPGRSDTKKRISCLKTIPLSTGFGKNNALT
jgi:hypothetical protein